MPAPPSFPRRYADFIDKQRWAIMLAAVMLAALAGFLASKLAVRADMATLLPPSAKSVKDLRALQKRARSFGHLFIFIKDPDAERRNRVAVTIAEEIRQIEHRVIGEVVVNDGVARKFYWENRHLFIDLDELTEARDALKDKIKEAKLAANPLYIDLDDDEDEEGEETSSDLGERVESLRDKLDDAESKSKNPQGLVAEKEQVQLVIVRSPYPSSNIGKAGKVLDLVAPIVRRARKGLSKEADIGVTGNIYTTRAEQQSILHGMLLAAGVTVLICTIALLLYYRSLFAVCASLWALAVGSVVTFGFTELVIGHLNLATAFLGAIVVGNGINSGLILLSRYFEERRRQNDAIDALAASLAGALPGTMGAAMTASVAYVSLVITDFRGFRHFGIIAGAGMLFCWLSAFTVLPAGLRILERAKLIKVRRPPAIGELLSRLLPRNLRRVVWINLVLIVVAVGLVVQFVRTGFLEEDFRRLRSENAVLAEARAWSARGKEIKAVSLGGRFIIGTNTREDARALVAYLRDVNDKRPEGEKLFAHINSLDDLLPDKQTEKIKLYGEIDQLLDELEPEDLSDDDQKLVERIRPPDKLDPMGYDDLPAMLAGMYVEQDGSRGRLIAARTDGRFHPWNVRDLVAFAEEMRNLDVPEGTTIGGMSFVFADMIQAMERDGPLSTLFALLGSVFAVGFAIGFRRHGWLTLACAASGTVIMVAGCYLAGIKANSFDFIAVPITIGIGIDYAINIAARDREDGERGPHYILGTTGGAVLLCSFTTIVGYGSLLLSDNGGIRSFGAAAIIGEFACLWLALTLVPSVLSLMRTRKQ